MSEFNDLDIKFSGGDSHGAEGRRELSEKSLDFKIENGQLHEVKAALSEKSPEKSSEAEEKIYKEEYYGDLLSPTEEKAEELFAEEAFSAESVAAQLAEEIFEEIKADAVAEEIYEEESEELLSPVSSELIAAANADGSKGSPSDSVLAELSFDSKKAKYDFINICVLAIMILFIAMTFIFMKNTLTGDEGVKLTAQTLKTGEYTEDLGERYNKNLPMEKLMAQANVLLRKLFGKTELEFIEYKDNEPPDGPIDNDDIGGIMEKPEDDLPKRTTASMTSSEGEATTTAKLPQAFEITTKPEENEESGIFTGRPIKTTTTKVTTTLDLPKTTEDTTTGKVNLIFPNE